jgi:hypothetical protein
MGSAGDVLRLRLHRRSTTQGGESSGRRRSGEGDWKAMVRFGFAFYYLDELVRALFSWCDSVGIQEQARRRDSGGRTGHRAEIAGNGTQWRVKTVPWWPGEASDGNVHLERQRKGTNSRQIDGLEVGIGAVEILFTSLPRGCPWQLAPGPSVD